MANNQPTPEIKTKFTLEGLRTAAVRLREFVGSARAAVAPIAVAGRAAARGIEAGSRATVESLRKITSAARSATMQMRLLSTSAIAVARAMSARVMSTIGTAAAYGSAGVGLAAAGITAAIHSTTGLVTEQERLSKATGASAAGLAGLMSAAAATGTEIGDVTTAVTTLTDKIADASRGGESAELFDRLGISVKRSNGQLRDSVDVLGDLIDRTRRLGKDERSGIFNELFDSDSRKLSGLLDGSSKSDITARTQEAQEIGAVASPAQVKSTNAFASAMRTLSLSLKGLGLEIASRFLPLLTDLVRQMAAFVAANRFAITDALVRLWDRFWQTVARVADAVWRIVRQFRLFDVARVSIGLVVQTLKNLFAIATSGSNTFFRDLVIIGVQILALVERVTRFGAANAGVLGVVTPAWMAFAKAIQDILWLLLGNPEMITTSWVAKLPETIAKARESLAVAMQFVKDLWSTLTFDDAAVSSQNNGLLDIRDLAIQVAVDIAAAVAGIAKTAFSAIVDAASDAWKTILNIARDAKRMYADARSVAGDIGRILTDGAGAKVDSDFAKAWKDDLVAVRTVVVEIAQYISRLWETFKGVMSTFSSIFDPILKIFGTDFMSTALVLGILKFTGILSVLGTAIGSVTTALTGLIGLGAGLNPIVKALALIGGGAAAGAWGAQKLYDSDIGGVRSRNLMGFGGNENAGLAAVAAIRLRAAYDHDRCAATRMPEYVPSGIASDVGGIDVWSGRPSKTVDVNLNVAGRSYTGRYDSNTADGLVRQLADVSRRGGY